MERMTLNNNPRVDAEKRYKLLQIRRDRLISYNASRFSIVRENDVASKMYINPYVKTEKASRLINAINKELKQIEKFLSYFK